MHDKEMSDLDGDFSDTTYTMKCPKCGSTMIGQLWESSCGGYEDYKYTCTNKSCNHIKWIEGSDA
jgi:ssDNA-binding Zn-finger/Zn-ribbon topoisomerase 1